LEDERKCIFVEREEVGLPVSSDEFGYKFPDTVVFADKQANDS